MDKKDDHSCKHSQRDSFIDTRAASHCYAFHSFPHPDDSASRYMQPRCTVLVNEALSAASDNVAMPRRQPVFMPRLIERSTYFLRRGCRLGAPSARSHRKQNRGPP